MFSGVDVLRDKLGMDVAPKECRMQNESWKH